MLESLSVQNFAIIDYMTVSFKSGLTVLTGETGAGKSIIIDAVMVLLGARASAEMIRAGSDKAYVEGVFDLAGHPDVRQAVRELGLAPEEDEEDYIFSREIAAGGKNLCRINGRTLTLAQYRGIAGHLIDIHGQKDHQLLMNPDKHVDMLDQYGGAGLLDLRARTEARGRALKDVEKALAELDAREKDKAARLDLLSFQIEEIRQAKPRKGEDLALQSEIQRLANAEKLLSGCRAAYERLYSGGASASSVSSAYDQISRALAQFHELVKYENQIADWIDKLEPALYIVEEAAGALSQYLETTEVSPARLEEAEKRLYVLRQLCKKYGPSIEDVLAFEQDAGRSLSALQNSEKRRDDLGLEREQTRAAYEALSAELTEARKKTAQVLEAQVHGELTDLLMDKAVFRVAVEAGAAEFHIAPNPGEPMLPLVKIASGGELSRVTLALKTALAQTDGCDTLVFDEIDAGIGGKSAQKVSEKLQAISRRQQVLCVTHSPILAAKAKQHLFLEKTWDGSRTRTGITELDREGRIGELSRMLSGDMDSEELRKHARLMLDG
ncbi:MAG: DNA repair protein RecN [Peptococcaceae bacterium]|jgi:DNA repair protein RecN (Recombination protein N)|nr:DNA repair protein RecN [Peptococcaceae bacterium]